MTSIVLLQVTNKSAITNANRTLEKPIALKHIQKWLTADQFQELESKYAEQKVFIWGAKSERAHQFGKIPSGYSVALFRRGQTVYKCGTITKWIFNPELAESLWGLDSDNETWSFVCFLKDVKKPFIPASQINGLIGRKLTDHWQGLTVVESPLADTVIDFVKLELRQALSRNI
jgi:hypothetical protein